MHRLTREIRFTISPFSAMSQGSNSYCSKPDCEGMGLFFSIWVELGGKIDADTGFVVNLADIDKVFRKNAVKIFDKAVKEAAGNKTDLTVKELINCLYKCRDAITGKFLPAKILSLTININPYRIVKIFTENENVIHYSEKFEFAAMHKLWNDSFSEDENYAKFGKCANPKGHGHNYIVEVTVEMPVGSDFKYGKFQEIVDRNLIELLDHKNLNEDVEHFRGKNPTVENITTYGWKCLKDKFDGAKLNQITIWENDRAYCTYRQ